MKRAITFLRIFIYPSLIILFVLAVMQRQQTVIRERDASPISYISEIYEHGRPVTVMDVIEDTFRKKRKITMVRLDEYRAEGYVTSMTVNELEAGQKVFIGEPGEESIGIVSYVSEIPDPDTGLYRVEMSSKNSLPGESGRFIARVKTEKIEKALEVPDEVLDLGIDGFYVWKVEKGKAVRTRVDLSLRSGEVSLVREGISEGDILVLSGQAMLSCGDKVRIVGEK